MLNVKFGFECEFTGITREVAAKKVAEFLGGTVEGVNTYNYSYKVIAPDGRVWKFVYDGSLTCQRKVTGSRVSASEEYSVEMVSPILIYEKDIETLQGIIRVLRKAGGFCLDNHGIHVHCDKEATRPKPCEISLT